MNLNLALFLGVVRADPHFLKPRDENKYPYFSAQKKKKKNVLVSSSLRQKRKMSSAIRAGGADPHFFGLSASSSYRRCSVQPFFAVSSNTPFSCDSSVHTYYSRTVRDQL
jgi:hypothetical protein